MRALELWGGVECTVNRVRDEYKDQTLLLGHQDRLSDLDRFAELGFKALRYPVLWERVAPGSLDDCDWRWSDERLQRLRELGIRPIVGLLHHGSGPRYTSLLDPEFPEKLSQYAAHVARRYPWADAYTPVNEPLTTARFSGLYGFWYPHGCDDRTFVRALLNQVKGTILAMRAIREVNPAAELIQTEDLAKTFSTPGLEYQARFDNERRWLTFDLLCGRMQPGHRLWRYLLDAGASESELRWMQANATPPDVCGFNHYLSSERFIDDRIELYPDCPIGGNAYERYVDVLAARVRPQGIAGAGKLLREAWDRFGLPLALTEVHNGCTREEQIRWLAEQWKHCSALRAEGVNVVALTVWTLLGAFDWDSLLTRDAGHYEPGAFDIRAPQPRPTAIARVAAELAAGKSPQHPVLASSGWWHRSDRYLPPHRKGANVIQIRKQQPAPILITGGRGTLGKAFARLCCARGLAHVLLTRPELDIADRSSVAHAVEKYRPWAIVNAAGYVRVDDAETEPERCFRENTLGAGTLAQVAAERGIQLVTFSSDLVFDGAQARPYVESSPTNPLNVYGASKLTAEQEVLARHPGALVVRTSAFFGPWDGFNFVGLALRALAAGDAFAASDHIVSPTYVPDLVHACLDLLIDGERGLLHLANAGETSWIDLARRAAHLAGLSPERVVPARGVLPAARPRYSVLASERLSIMPPLEDALHRFMRQCEVAWVSPPEERPLAA